MPETATATPTFETFMRSLLAAEGRAHYESRIPRRAMEALDRYLIEGILPGSALQSILRRDNVVDTVFRCDRDYIEALPAICGYVHNCVPGIAWGSPEKVNGWPEYRRTWELREKARVRS